MRKLKEIIRLHGSQLSQQQIARSLNVSVGAVNKYLKLAEQAGVRWPLPEEMGEKEVRALIMPNKEACSSFIQPDYNWIYKELKHKSVTLHLVHEEYCQLNPGKHYKYPQFCTLYKRWKKGKNLSLPQEHTGGEKFFTDYAGPTVPIVINRRTGEVRSSQIFVGVLGASSLTYAEATWSQELPHWIGSHTRAFDYFGGIPAALVPDNLKSGVTSACKYDPDINPEYASMAEYYDTAIVPARPYRPKDKAKVESGVLVVERWILARLRHYTFYSLEELNAKIRELLEDLNTRPFKKIKGSRRELFEEVDKPALKPLPQKPYEFARFYHRQVTNDYHIQHGEHFYSVSYLYVGKEVDIRVTERVIEVLHDGKRIAVHARKDTKGKTTLPEHMPKRHLKHVEWTLEKALEWSEGIGSFTKLFVDHLSLKKNHSDQITRLCSGLRSLAKNFGEDRLEAACHRALHYQAYSYKSLNHILENNLDREKLETETLPPSIQHKNIRGSAYYH